MLGSRTVTTYVDRGREYNVILQGQDADRASPDDLRNLYVRSQRGGALIPLANLVVLEEEAGPEELSRYDRMRAITLGRVNASERKMTAGCCWRTSRISHSQNANGLVWGLSTRKTETP